MGRVGFGLGHIILLFFLIRFEFDPIKFGSKFLIHTRPDPCKIIKYLLIIFI
jgi:hypothetical protein